MCGLTIRDCLGLLVGLGLGLLIGLVIPRPADVDLAARSTSASFDESEFVSILATPDRLQRERRLLALFEGLPPGELDRVRASFDRLRPNLDASAILAFMDWWAGFDPGSAFATAGSFGDLGTLARATVVRRWAQRDPTLASESLAASDDRHPPQLVLALVRGWGEADREGAWRYAEALPMGALRQQAIGTLVHQLLLHEGPDAVTAFVESLPDSGLNRFKLQAFRQAAAALAMRSPERATAWAERHYQGPFGDGLLFKVGLSWVLLDGESAVSWLSSLPADEAQQYAMRAAYGFWLQRDRARARAWLQESGEKSRALEPAWALLAFDLGSDDPHAGLDLLSSVPMEQALRERTTIGLVSAWMQRDPDGARSWLASARLPEDVVVEILEARRPTRRRAARSADARQAEMPAEAQN